MKKYWWWVGGMAAICVLIVGGLQWWKFAHFGYNGLDLGIYTQTIWSLAHGHGFASSIHDPSYLGDHIELWLLPVAAIYRLLPSPLTLLFIQTLVMAISVWPLMILSRNILGDRPSLLVGALFWLHPFVYNVAIYEWHGLVFALPLLLWAIVAYQSQRFWTWVLLLTAVVVVREDLPLVLMGWALLAAIDRRSRKWWITPAILAVAWWMSAQFIIAQANPLGSYKYLAFYRWLGSTPVSMVTFPFQHPIIFLSHIWQPNNWLTILGFLLSFGFLPLFKKRLLIPVGLLAGQLLLLGADPQSILKLHYTVPYIPFLAWSALVAFDDIRHRKIWRRFDGSIAKILVVVLIIVGPLYTSLLIGPIEWPWKKTATVQTTDPNILDQATNLIQPNDRLLTTFHLLPHLANRANVYSFNYLYLGRRQYTEVPYTLPGPIDVAVIDWQELYRYQFLYRDTLFQGKTGPQRVQQLLADQGLHLSQWHDSLAIYTLSGQSDYRPTEKIMGQVPPPMASYGPLQLLSNEAKVVPVSGATSRHIALDLGWQVQKKVERPVSIRFTLRQGPNTAWSSTRLLGQEFYPTLEWQLHESWRTRYQLVVPPAMRGSYRLTAEIIEQSGATKLNRWRSFGPVVTEERSYGSIEIGRLVL